MKHYDITPIISSEMAVFPGDTPFSRHVEMSFEKGDHLELSSMKTTLHIGAHADAPCHYHSKGISIEKREITRYLGPCQVIDVSAQMQAKANLPDDQFVITVQDIQSKKITAKRILFKTNTFLDLNNWSHRFAAIHPEVIRHLKNAGCFLVGIDTPSVDPSESKTLECHKLIFESDFAILEGVVLNQAPEGLYILVALPLPLKDADASPVRAILVPPDVDLRTL